MRLAEVWRKSITVHLILYELHIHTREDTRAFKSVYVNSKYVSV